MNQIVRADPRLSINKLGEYMVAKAARRRKILEDAKRPSSFITARYTAFYDVAPAYSSSNPLNDSLVHAAIQSLQTKPASTEWEVSNQLLNTDLLTNLLDLADILDIEDYTVTVLPISQASMLLNGVEISVRPELKLSIVTRSKSYQGVLKFYLPKTNPLDRESGEYIATVAHQWATTEFASGDPVHHRHCHVIDVPNRTRYSAPGSHVRRMQDVAAACTEIATLWPTI